MARTLWTSWAADGHPFKPARPSSTLFNPLYTDQRWECALCIVRARTFNPVMEFLGSRPIRHTTRTCVCSFAPASTHRQIDDFGFYSKTCLFCQWWNSKATAEFFRQSLGAKCKPPFEKSQVVKLWRGASVRLLCCIYATFLADCFHYYSVPP